MCLTGAVLRAWQRVRGSGFGVSAGSAPTRRATWAGHVLGGVGRTDRTRGRRPEWPRASGHGQCGRGHTRDE
eukprot:360357-Chlamydomonas_euryale.AAC.3